MRNSESSMSGSDISPEMFAQSSSSSSDLDDLLALSGSSSAGISKGSSSFGGSSSSFGGSSSSFGSKGTRPLSEEEIGFIVVMVFAAIFAGLQLWRYSQTRTKFHQIICIPILVFILSLGLCIGGARIPDGIMIGGGVIIFMLSVLMLKLLVSHLFNHWCRSMTGVHSEKTHITRKMYLGSVANYSIGTLLLVTSIALSIKPPRRLSLRTIPTLFRLGYSFLLITDIVLTGVFVWLLVETPNNGSAELGRKRRELIVLAAHTVTMFIADLCFVLFEDYAGYAFLLLFLGASLYPLNSMGGFEQAPDLTNYMPNVMPTNVMGQPPNHMANNPNVIFVPTPPPTQPEAYSVNPENNGTHVVGDSVPNDTQFGVQHTNA
ncbi:hypothetical protein BDF22DRAFT_689899 [Syncephalis plumigaleata]|nr:hypothetical protein BDF22DRAFT_689899 [Syncephalis plumigaleata]